LAGSERAFPDAQTGRAHVIRSRDKETVLTKQKLLLEHWRLGRYGSVRSGGIAHAATTHHCGVLHFGVIALVGVQ
jgi:hypothetical protein